MKKFRVEGFGTVYLMDGKDMMLVIKKIEIAFWRDQTNLCEQGRRWIDPPHYLNQSKLWGMLIEDYAPDQYRVLDASQALNYIYDISERIR